MRNYLITLCTLGLSTLAASTQFAGIQSAAAGVQRESESFHQLLKAKAPDATALQESLQATAANIEKMQALAAEVDSGTLATRHSPHWAEVKERIQLLAIFHQAKRDLMTSGELRKQRSLLRAHAEGLAKRAALLQKSASRLALP